MVTTFLGNGESRGLREDQGSVWELRQSRVNLERSQGKGTSNGRSVGGLAEVFRQDSQARYKQAKQLKAA